MAWVPEVAGKGLRDGHSPGCVLVMSRRNRPLTTRTGASRGADRAGHSDSETARRDFRLLESLAARLVPLTDSAYPKTLSMIADAPPLLLLRGELAALSGPSIAIIGARAATRAGRAQARRLARELAAHGLTIVSGLARGIDAEAHRGALEVGGRTVAVLASGLDRIYPPEHRALAEEILVDGAMISEMPLGTSPRRELFPLRNRIISGLCVGVIVVEARRRSGSLITVRHALNQGREVFVVPGASEGPFAEGSNRLLRDGARAISTAADVLEDLAGLAGSEVIARPSGFERPRNSPRSKLEGKSAEVAVSPIEQRIRDRLAMGPASREELIAMVEIDSGKLARALLDLELSGRIIEERDGRFHLCWG